MVKSSGNLIIGGEVFNINAPLVNWHEGPKWDATSEYCIPTNTERALRYCLEHPQWRRRH